MLASINKQARSFTELRDELGQSDGGLGRHLKVLADAGYVTLTKSFQDSRPRTDVELTNAGRSALEQERRALTELISDLPDPFAFPAGAGKRFAASARTTDLILSETFSPFYVAEQCPLGPDFALPEGFPAWSSYPAQRATFLSHGLLGSHLRRWTTVTKEEWINTLLLEFDDADAPERIMSGLAEPTVYVPGVLPTRAYQQRDTCVIWLRRGPFLACISVSGDKDVALNRANTLVRDQYRLLPPSDRDAAEPTAAPIARETSDRDAPEPVALRIEESQK
ncbi:MAG TPA: transcriptional regulator [Pseudonocardiaceae bacterium]